VLAFVAVAAAGKRAVDGIRDIVERLTAVPGCRCRRADKAGELVFPRFGGHLT
jgi:hypothetical protein